MVGLRKYPRTHHLEGSRRQPGDEDLNALPFSQLAGRDLVVEEKLDGANAAVSFGPSGELLLQSRGHYLTGGPRERHFDLFKSWASCHQAALHSVLGSRYVLYGEWLYAKHTVFYDALPHYFLEFDILDRVDNAFLSTERRQELLAKAPVLSAPVLWTGRLKLAEELLALVGPSPFRTPAWPEVLRQACRAAGVDPERAFQETDATDLMEGLYVKVEQDGRVVGRYKYVRVDFLTAVLDSGNHWLSRPIIPNQLRDGMDLWGTAGE
jgi:RNA ligase-like protein